MDVLTIEAHGRSYEIEDPGGLIGEALRAGNPYEHPVCEHIFSRGFEGLAVDAGASIGNHTLWLAAICGLEVEAFEPLSYTALTANAARNELIPGRVRVHPFALGARETRAADVGKGMLKLDRGGIPVYALDDFNFTDVCLLKVDVEGMEAEVLKGALATIERERPVIYAEAWNPAAHRRVAEVLEPLDYEHQRTFGATPLEEWEPA